MPPPANKFAGGEFQHNVTNVNTKFTDVCKKNFAMFTNITIFAPDFQNLDVMDNTKEKKPIKWWLMLLISILSAIAGSISENATGMIGRIF